MKMCPDALVGADGTQDTLLHSAQHSTLQQVSGSDSTLFEDLVEIDTQTPILQGGLAGGRTYLGTRSAIGGNTSSFAVFEASLSLDYSWIVRQEDPSALSKGSQGIASINEIVSVADKMITDPQSITSHIPLERVNSLRPHCGILAECLNDEG